MTKGTEWLATVPRPDFRLSDIEREAVAAELAAGVSGYDIPARIVQAVFQVGQSTQKT